MTIFIVLFTVFCIMGLLILGTGWALRWIGRNWSEWRISKRTAVIFGSTLLITSPYLAFKAWELNAVLARVPEPLRVAWIEYRLEEAWGFGPGGNETGFVVYRLTKNSADWTRRQGARLGAALPGGSDTWRPTPVPATGAPHRWHRYDNDAAMRTVGYPHGPNIAEYLDQYGFTIPIKKGQDAEADKAIQSTGSFYSYGRGGSITVVDPTRGKVYFAYAG